MQNNNQQVNVNNNLNPNPPANPQIQVQGHMPAQAVFAPALIQEGREMVRKSHYRTTRKVLKYWLDNPNISAAAQALRQSDLKKIIEIAKKQEMKKNKPRWFKEEKYFVPVFSIFRGQYQMDLLEQSSKVSNTITQVPARMKNCYPRYYLILINVNTRYAFAYPQLSKRTNDVINNFNLFLNDPIVSQGGGVQHITCDDEKAFRSNAFLNLLQQQGIGIKFNTDQKHTTLSIIDRFIRTLRDMNTPHTKAEFAKGREGSHPKYRDFSQHRMKKLIDIYNKTPVIPKRYDPIVPEDLMQNPQKEEDYIMYRLFWKEKVLNQADWDLPIGTRVRYLIMNYETTKRRYGASPEWYIVTAKQGYSYIIRAMNNATRSFPRWRLVPLQPFEANHVYKFASDFPKMSSIYLVSKISDYDINIQKYKVHWDGYTETTWEPVANLRIGPQPNRQTKAERIFWKSRLGQRIIVQLPQAQIQALNIQPNQIPTRAQRQQTQRPTQPAQPPAPPQNQLRRNPPRRARNNGNG